MSDGKAQFYSVYGADGTAINCLVLSDGRSGGFCFNTNFNPNAYALPDYNVLPDPAFETELLLTKRMYIKAEEDRDAFFKFVNRLMKMSDYLTIEKGRAVFNRYFEDKAAAHAMLKQLRADVAKMRKKDDALDKLRSRRILHCSTGCFVISPDDLDVYYVPKGHYGTTFRVCWNWLGDLRSTVNRAVLRGKEPNALACVGPQELEEVIWVLTNPNGSVKELDRAVNVLISQSSFDSELHV